MKDACSRVIRVLNQLFENGETGMISVSQQVPNVIDLAEWVNAEAI
jgi:hypothetical protein